MPKLETLRDVHEALKWMGIKYESREFTKMALIIKEYIDIFDQDQGEHPVLDQSPPN